tara:strand:+ start:2064 stop:2411 length:348 start_codon:yes stop_codon:yes gene_type:complete
MAYKAVKYKLNSDGTIPSFLYGGNDGSNGNWPNQIAGVPGPQDMWLVGIADNGATIPTDQAEEIASKTDLVTYLNTYTSTWTQPDPANPGLDNEIPFDQDVAATGFWNKLDSLNA